MKSIVALSFLLSYPYSIHASSTRGLRKKQAYTKSVKIDECSGQAILPLVQDNPHFSAPLDALEQPLEAAIDSLCDDHHRSLQDTEAIPFSYATGRGRQFDKNYFDGGTDWNTGVEGTSKEASNKDRILAVADTLAARPLTWPSYITNFDDMASCQLRTAMCCFTKSQDPSTGIVGNIQEFPSSIPNADVCTVHLDRSPQAGHVASGKTYYADGRSVEDETKDAYCTGFSWTEDETDISTRYRANTLFYISMLDGLQNNNLVGGIPGSPMCGCVEQMPVVSHSKCVKPVQARRLSVLEDNRLLIDASVDFIPCDDDSLVGSYSSDGSSEDDVEALSKIITGSCVDAVDEELKSLSYKRGDAWWYADDKQWFPVVGEKFLYHPEISSEDFKKAFDASSTKTIRRVCTSCTSSHRDIYYKRLTDVPESLDLLEMLKNSFSSESNVHGIDFEMYSKAKDGSMTTWQYCNYSASHGFPFECGPYDAVERQWTSYTSSSGTYAKHFAFYIEK